MEIHIKNYYPSQDDEKVILYEIEIISQDKAWRIEKRFKQFKQLHQKLKEYFGNQLPELPKQTYTTFIVKKSHEQINERKKGLEIYLQYLVTNEQILNSVMLKEFISYPNQKNPKLLLENSKTFELGIRDFYSYDDTLYVLMSEMNPLNRATVSISNMKLPWQDEIEISQLKPLGYLDCYINNNVVWRKKYYSQPICMYCIKNTIVIGLDNGIINLLKYESKNHLENSIEYPLHTARVMGICLYGVFLYSVSKDKKYKVQNIENNEILVDLYHKHELTCLKYDNQRDYVFIGDREGIVYAYQMATLKISIDTNLQFVRDLIIYNNRNSVIAIGFQSGQAAILNIINNQIQMSDIEAFKNKAKSRCISYSLLREEIYIGTQDGYITIWDLNKRVPICEIQLHNGPITKIMWNDDEELLYTSSKDKTLKITYFNQKSESQLYNNNNNNIGRYSGNLQNIHL